LANFFGETEIINLSAIVAIRTNANASLKIDHLELTKTKPTSIYNTLNANPQIFITYEHTTLLPLLATAKTHQKAKPYECNRLRSKQKMTSISNSKFIFEA
jgi:hypothetical protein